MPSPSPILYFKTSPEVIRLTDMMYIRFPPSLRDVEDVLHERGIEISHDTARFCCSRFRRMQSLQMFASERAWAHNHCPTERHLQNRDHYKQSRAAALAEWRGLLAA